MTSVGSSLRGGEQCKLNSCWAGLIILIMQHTCMHRLEYPHIYIDSGVRRWSWWEKWSWWERWSRWLSLARDGPIINLSCMTDSLLGHLSVIWGSQSINGTFRCSTWFSVMKKPKVLASSPLTTWQHSSSKRTDQQILAGSSNNSIYQLSSATL